ncbi:glycoside hydrolase family 88 protein [Mongoliibacter ruber]|uniref:Glycosyl hydrolase family 88 n=1 Tax=Mongoliibacter ruber TaxID=1750599 RepID=A0A2T0WNT4_9BACT|nr:glycoside hydrolase family 88 protein [Mongoliibacter ruber]PRY88368.1 glycosyl hydrolase family 88 [Mongoliibacter ruber]
MLILLIISIFLNFLVLKLDIIPYITNVFQKRKLRKRKVVFDRAVFEKKVYNASIETIKGTKVKMQWTDTDGFSNNIVNIYLNKYNNNFRKYNYPRALLMYGLLKYSISKKNDTGISVVRDAFDKLLDAKGNPKFNLDKVDQAIFGVVAVDLYTVLNNKKYLNFASIIYSYLEENYLRNNNVILYRPNIRFWFNDVLGQTIPFLVSYYTIAGEKRILDIAKSQMNAFIKHGIDNHTFLPSHGFNLDTYTKIGSINWGRGIGWYLLALNALHKLDGSYMKEYNGLIYTLNKLKLNNIWTQFPGSDINFDASTTTMMLYCFPEELVDVNIVLETLNNFTSKDGFILQTSGDTKGFNNYSRSFGKSEISQGMLMAYLSRIK